MSDWITVAKAGEIAPGGYRVVDADGTHIAVFNLDGAYYAIEDVCTHDDGPLGEGTLRGAEVECPRHGAKFDVRDGRVLCLPAPLPIPTYEVKVEGEAIKVKAA